jgi:hypothetical protein
MQPGYEFARHILLENSNSDHQLEERMKEHVIRNPPCLVRRATATITRALLGEINFKLRMDGKVAEMAGIYKSKGS